MSMGEIVEIPAAVAKPVAQRRHSGVVDLQFLDSFEIDTHRQVFTSLSIEQTRLLQEIGIPVCKCHHAI